MQWNAYRQSTFSLPHRPHCDDSHEQETRLPQNSGKGTGSPEHERDDQGASNTQQRPVHQIPAPKVQAFHAFQQYGVLFRKETKEKVKRNARNIFKLSKVPLSKVVHRASQVFSIAVFLCTVLASSYDLYEEIQEGEKHQNKLAFKIASVITAILENLFLWSIITAFTIRRRHLRNTAADTSDSEEPQQKSSEEAIQAEYKKQQYLENLIHEILLYLLVIMGIIGFSTEYHDFGDDFSKCDWFCKIQLVLFGLDVLEFSYTQIERMVIFYRLLVEIQVKANRAKTDIKKSSNFLTWSIRGGILPRLFLTAMSNVVLFVCWCIMFGRQVYKDNQPEEFRHYKLSTNSIVIMLGLILLPASSLILYAVVNLSWIFGVLTQVDTSDDKIVNVDNAVVGDVLRGGVERARKASHVPSVQTENTILHETHDRQASMLHLSSEQEDNPTAIDNLSRCSSVNCVQSSDAEQEKDFLSSLHKENTHSSSTDGYVDQANSNEFDANDPGHNLGSQMELVGITSFHEENINTSTADQTNSNDPRHNSGIQMGLIGITQQGITKDVSPSLHEKNEMSLSTNECVYQNESNEVDLSSDDQKGITENVSPSLHEKNEMSLSTNEYAYQNESVGVDVSSGDLQGITENVSHSLHEKNEMSLSTNECAYQNESNEVDVIDPAHSFGSQIELVGVTDNVSCYFHKENTVSSNTNGCAVLSNFNEVDANDPVHNPGSQMDLVGITQADSVLREISNRNNDNSVNTNASDKIPAERPVSQILLHPPTIQSPTPSNSNPYLHEDMNDQDIDNRALNGVSDIYHEHDGRSCVIIINEADPQHCLDNTRIGTSRSVSHILLHPSTTQSPIPSTSNTNIQEEIDTDPVSPSNDDNTVNNNMGNLMNERKWKLLLMPVFDIPISIGLLLWLILLGSGLYLYEDDVEWEVPIRIIIIIVIFSANHQITMLALLVVIGVIFYPFMITIFIIVNNRKPAKVSPEIISKLPAV